MSPTSELDCVVIGYNDTPFEQYEQLIYQYGEDSEAYRDLKYSYIDIENKKYNYVDFLNHIYRVAKKETHEDIFKSGEIPNLGAVYLTNFLQNRGLSAQYINLFQYEKEKLKAYLALNPYCVAITTTFYVLNRPVIEMIEFIREHSEKTKIVVGGPLISNHFNRYPHDQMLYALEDIGADIYVIESQGELTLAAIVNCLKRGADLSSIPNLIHYNHDGKLEMTSRLAENNSLDTNYINWCSFPNEKLGPTLQMRTARSCAFSCSFCAYPIRAGKLTLASLETIEKELDSMHNLGNVNNVIFIDDTFNVPLNRFKDICRLMIRKDYNFKWFSYFRCSNSDEEAIALMAESGCSGVFLGVESGSPTILKHMHKAATIEKYVQGIEWLRKHGIFTFGSFITGFPGETETTINETIDFIKETKLDYYRTQLWYCEPGTPIYDKRDEYKILGQGFKWEHSTMNSAQAMDYIDQIFLSVTESTWLPIWSFDFWFIPYILGKGIRLEQFNEFVAQANKMMALNIISHVPDYQKQKIKQDAFRNLVNVVGEWQPI
jgi:radical SAM PhpK family P-methyltransferase